MHKAVILALLAATAAQAQTVTAGARALVNSDTLPVYASMSDSTEVKVALKRGEVVIIGLVLFGSDTTWCAISKAGQSKRLGYVSCEFLEPDRGLTAAPEAPPAPPLKSEPIKIREIPQAPVTVREVPPATPPPDPVLAPAPVREPEPPAITQSEFVELLLDGAGLRSSFVNYTQSTHLLSFLDKGRLAEIELPTLERVLSKWFRPGAFYMAVGGQVSKNYSPERIFKVVEWLRSPVTNKLAALERRAFSPDAREELMAFAGNLSEKPPSQPRLVLVHRLYEALRTCDMEVEVTIALVHAVAQAIGPALPKEKRYSAAELDRALGAVKARYRSIMKNAGIVHYLFAYRDVSDEELDQYVGFLETENGKWLIAVVDKGFLDASESISRGLRTDIPRNVKPRRRLPDENTAKGLLP